MKTVDGEDASLLRQPESNMSAEDEESVTTENESLTESNPSSSDNETTDDNSVPKNENSSETEAKPRDKTNDVIFLDACKSKSDCVILDLLPYCVNNHCVVFGNDGNTRNTTDNATAVVGNGTTELKPYLDSISLGCESSCRVCHCNGDEQLISPCDCSGSVKWVHETCLIKWMKSSFKESCELCRREIEITKRRKPLSKWKLPSQRPTPVLWVLVFITAIALNLASVVKDASRECSSTPCIVFYAVGCIGVVLGTLFLIYWSKRAKHFINQWLEQNEEWVVLLDNMEKRDGRYSSTTNVQIPTNDVVLTNVRT